MRKLSSRGFTLIELLVVIAIIGILSSVILASLNTARAKANDARRVSDLREMQKALELYSTSNNGSYPSTGGAFYSQCYYSGATQQGTANAVIPGLVASGAIGSIPSDPEMVAGSNPTNGTCCYLYKSDGTNYKLMVGFNCTTANYNNSSLSSLLDPARASTPRDWAVYTPGASAW